MNHLPYRAIALDLDGTLTNHDKVVTPKTREALLQAEAEGVVIILASGRPTYGIEPVAECLELDKRGGYILSYNGGNIVNAKTGEKLFAQFLPDEVIPILYRYAKEKNNALLGYAGNEIITEMPDDQYVKEESRINKMNIRKVENLFEALDSPNQAPHDGRPGRYAQGRKRAFRDSGRQDGHLPFSPILPGAGSQRHRQGKVPAPPSVENQSHPSRYDCFRRWLQRPEHAETGRHGCSHAECSTRG